MNRDDTLLEERELKLCEALLKLDQRNFHCWNHWMLICKRMNLSLENQLAFTWSRITENASNYSAWHFRGQLLKELLLSKYRDDPTKCIDYLTSELEVNLNALYTECDDQSSWYYMRTLIYIARELQQEKIIDRLAVDELIHTRMNELNELIDFAPDCLYGAQFLKELKSLCSVCLYSSVRKLFERIFRGYGLWVWDPTTLRPLPNPSS